MSAIFASHAMRRLVDQVDRIAGNDFAVLITGETGAGKEVIARLVYERSRRANAPFIDFNCAAIPEALFESELFGFEQGAFSGALKPKPGLFELAHGGTLLLDEIGEIPKTSQAKLLRVLDGMPYYRLGGTRKMVPDVRILAATNQDLESASVNGSFRADLYYRLAEVHLRVPPLRERTPDIAPLAAGFLAQVRAGLQLSPGAIRLLEDHSWPGNVRELRNAVIAAAIQTDTEIIPAQAFSSVGARTRGAGHQTLAAQERTLILGAIAATNGNRMRAAARLGISRRTLSRKLREFATPAPPPTTSRPVSDLEALDRAIRQSSLSSQPARV